MDPSDNEEAYIKREELERLRKQREAAATALAEREREELKRRHWMRCPKCGLELAEIAYRGVNVDACFSCGGMYFDAGEVDKVLDHDEPGVLRQMIGSLFGR